MGSSCRRRLVSRRGRRAHIRNRGRALMRHYPILTLLGMLIVVYQHHQPRAVILTHLNASFRSASSMRWSWHFQGLCRRGISLVILTPPSLCLRFPYLVESLRAAGHISQTCGDSSTGPWEIVKMILFKLPSKKTIPQTSEEV